jgi:CubicO group peptidase (beta-lactamase class C family)
VKKGEKTPNAAALLKTHFNVIQTSIKAPSLAYGMTFGNKKIAVHNSTLQFRIASMSKSFTAAAILLLRDRNKLQLDQPVGDIVPELKNLPLPTSDSPKVTIRHLLTMSSGLATDDPWGDRHLDADHEFMQQLFADGGYFANPPGTDFCYSNYGYAILGRVISNASSQSFQEFISQEILAPIGMHSTGWTPAAHHATPHRRRADAAIDDGMPPLADGGFASMGGIWSNVDDLLLWANFMLNAFPARDGRDEGPLCRASRREMQQISRAMQQSSMPNLTQLKIFGGYGMGLRIFDSAVLGYLVSHSGGLPGYGSNMIWHPERQYALISLANVTYAPMFDANILALQSLQHEGVLPAPRVRPTGNLQKHAEALVAWLNTFDEERGGKIFADNVALDETFKRRQQAFDCFSSNRGPYKCGEIVAQNAACADVVMLDRDGNPTLKLSFKLSPQVPPLIQWYEVNEIAPAEKEVVSV